MRAWAAALLLLAAATAREVVRLRSRPSRRLSFTGIAEPGDGYDDGRRLAETRTQKHRRANLPRRTSAFSSRHDDNV